MKPGVAILAVCGLLRGFMIRVQIADPVRGQAAPVQPDLGALMLEQVHDAMTPLTVALVQGSRVGVLVRAASLPRPADTDRRLTPARPVLIHGAHKNVVLAAVLIRRKMAHGDDLPIETAIGHVGRLDLNAVGRGLIDLVAGRGHAWGCGSTADRRYTLRHDDSFTNENAVL